MPENNGFGINRGGFGIGSGGGGGGGSSDVYYNRAWLTQSTSYANYDEAWRISNSGSVNSAGGNTYNEAIPVTAAVQQLSPDIANNRYDYLLYKNINSNYFRFSGENGGYYDESDGNYYTVNGVLSDKATEFPVIDGTAYWWVIDHLTGYKWPSESMGFATWATNMSDVPTWTANYGAQNWVCPSKNELLQLANNMNRDFATFTGNGNRPFFVVSYTNSFTGTTDAATTTNAFAWKHNDQNGYAPSQAKTSGASKRFYFVLELTGTIPQ